MVAGDEGHDDLQVDMDLEVNHEKQPMDTQKMVGNLLRSARLEQSMGDRDAAVVTGSVELANPTNVAGADSAARAAVEAGLVVFHLFSYLTQAKCDLINILVNKFMCYPF